MYPIPVQWSSIRFGLSLRIASVVQDLMDLYWGMAAVVRP